MARRRLAYRACAVSRDGDASVTLIRAEDLIEIEAAKSGRERCGPMASSCRGRSRCSTAATSPRSGDKAGGYPVAVAGTVRYCEKEGATWAVCTR